MDRGKDRPTEPKAIPARGKFLKSATSKATPSTSQEHRRVVSVHNLRSEHGVMGPRLKKFFAEKRSQQRSDMIGFERCLDLRRVSTRWFTFWLSEINGPDDDAVVVRRCRERRVRKHTAVLKCPGNRDSVFARCRIATAVSVWLRTTQP